MKRNNGVVALLLVGGYLIYKKGGLSGGGGGGALSGWSVTVHRPTESFEDAFLGHDASAMMGHNVTRTVGAVGTVKNTGNVTGTFTVRLAGAGDSVTVTLGPGQSQLVSLSGTISLDSGQTFTPRVILDIDSPNVAVGVDTYVAPTYTEQHTHAAAGTLSGWSTNVGRRRLGRV